METKKNVKEVAKDISTAFKKLLEMKVNEQLKLKFKDKTIILQRIK